MNLNEEDAFHGHDRTRNVRALVHELARSFDEHMRLLTSKFQLTPTQAAALRELNKAITMRDLADRLCCEPSNVTFVVDRLEERGLLDRRPHPSDRRAKHLVLTPAGQQLRVQLMATLDRNTPLKHLSEAQIRALEAELSRALGRDGGAA